MARIQRRNPALLLTARTASAPLRLLLLLLVPVVSLAAQPMRLDDSTPRWVSVKFETSASDHPELLDRRYGLPHRAWLEPAADGTIRVRIDADVLEQSLFRDRNPVPGSFSDYIWSFEPRTGDVLSASFSGRVTHALSWGLGTIDVEARVEARMTTTRPGGFRPARPVWGSRLHGFCDDPSASGCTLVSPRRLDRSSGYVNAPGFLRIDSRFLDFSTFSALGEAQFSELDEPSQLADRAADPPEEHARGGRSSDRRAAPALSVRDVAAPPPIR